MIRYDHYTDKFVKVSDRECPWCKAVCASTDKYCHECGWHIADTPQTETKGVGYCNECKWFRDKQVCGRCRSRNLFAKADTPLTDAEITEMAKGIVHKMIDNSDIAEDAYPGLRQRMHEAVERLDEYYPSENERKE